jgi:uncharacterized protein YkwD
VEVEIVTVAGVSGVGGPDLEAGEGIAGEDGGGEAAVEGVVDEIGTVERAGRPVRGARRGAGIGMRDGGLFRIGGGQVGGTIEEGIGRGEARRLLDQVGVDEEELEVGFGEGLLDADAIESRGCGAVGVADWIVPEAGGTVAALGDPDAGGGLAEMADVGLDGGADLGADALVGSQEGKVAVGGGAGNDVNEAGLLEVAEGADEVLFEGVELVQRGGVEALPEAGGLGVVGLAGELEGGLVFPGGDDLASQVFGELGEEGRVAELLEEDGGEIEVELGGDVVALEVGEDAEEREIGLGGGLVQPLHAVGPGAVVDDVGQVRVHGAADRLGDGWPDGNASTRADGSGSIRVWMRHGRNAAGERQLRESGVQEGMTGPGLDRPYRFLRTLLLGFCACLLAECATAQGLQPNLGEQYLLSAANQERTALGIAPLTWSPELADAALNHARVMASQEAISHQFSDEPDLQNRIQAAGLDPESIAENVAFAPSLLRIHSGWMNSPGHRANLLNPAYTILGVAVIVSGREIYAVEDFAGHPTAFRRAVVPAPAPAPTFQAQVDTPVRSLPGDAERYLFEAANRERAQMQLAPLHWDAALAAAAAGHAAVMADHRGISHQFSGEPELSARGAAAGARFTLISENVAEAPSAAIIHNAWMHSQGHRDNLLDAHVDAVGIAVVRRNGQLYAVQDFAHTTRSLTLEQQETMVAALLDQTGVTILPGATADARETCLAESGYRGTHQPGFIMRYTAASLDRLPDEVTPRLASGRYRHASIGACSGDHNDNFTSYRIAILLYP